MFTYVARHLRRLHHDRSGQSMVLIVLTLALLVAFSSAVINTGAHVAVRQQLQTAADAGAYSGAAVKAKAMNVIALTNLTMATLMGFQVVAKFAKWGTIAVEAVLAGLCVALIFPACVAAEAVDVFRQITGPFLDGVIELLDALMTIVELIATAVAYLAPLWATYTVHRVAVLNGANYGLALFGEFALPTKKVSRSYLCDRVARTAHDWVLEQPILGDLSILSELAAAAVQGVASVLCGGADSYTFERPEDAVGSTDCAACRAADIEATGWERIDGTEVTVTENLVQGAWRSASTSQVALGGGAMLRAEGDAAADLLDASGPSCTQPVERHHTELRGVDPQTRQRVTRHERYRFRGCSFHSEPSSVDAADLGVEGGECPGPHPRLLGRAGEDCGGEPMSIDAVRAEHWLEVGAAVGLSVEPGPMAGLVGERDARTVVTFAQAEFYGAAGDLWHTDWRARLTPMRPGGWAQLGALAVTALSVLNAGGEGVSANPADLESAAALGGL